MKNSIIVFKILDGINPFNIFGKKLDGKFLSEKEFVETYGRECADDFIDAFLEYSEEDQVNGISMWQNGIHSSVKKLSFQQMRKDAGFTQKTFAEYLWIPKRTIENWESNVCEPPSYVVELIYYKLRGEKKL